jgi:hypothetical protein
MPEETTPLSAMTPPAIGLSALGEHPAVSARIAGNPGEEHIAHAAENRTGTAKSKLWPDDNRARLREQFMHG